MSGACTDFSVLNVVKSVVKFQAVLDHMEKITAPDPLITSLNPLITIPNPLIPTPNPLIVTPSSTQLAIESSLASEVSLTSSAQISISGCNSSMQLGKRKRKEGNLDLKEERDIFGKLTDGCEKLEQLLKIHEMDPSSFVEKWGCFKHTTFANLCCAGENVCWEVKKKK
ncbi:hypothetical protein HK096_011214 [Nowakowskiella sp. JEL0078]|nr:hypothetical protein HK096_011214 [Nowakowskiella sp. JEL0078]